MRERWLSKRALLLHLCVIVWVPGCAIAAWWQVTVALAGDDLAYLYSVEWPVFAIFGAVFWWHAVHDDPSTVGARGLARIKRVAAQQGEPVADGHLVRTLEDEDPELAAYNDYLARLSASDERKSWHQT